MAMKIRMRHTAIGAAIFIITILFLQPGAFTTGTPDRGSSALLSVMSTEFPEDPKAASSALQGARRSLAKLQPSSLYIVINTSANVLAVRSKGRKILEAPCSTGSGGTLIDATNGRKWVFETPSGTFRVTSKIVDPWWRRPDWAYIEENQPIPESEMERFDPQMLGDYAIGFGDGYFIHGTPYELLLGISVTHGCVRLGEKDLKNVFNLVAVGTPIYIF